MGGEIPENVVVLRCLMSRIVHMFTSALAIPILWGCTATACQCAEPLPAPGPAVEKPAPRARTEIYNFQELLSRSERIVVADVGATRDGLTKLSVRETIKAPASDRKIVSTDKRKRAADLLNEAAAANPGAGKNQPGVAAALADAPGPAAVYVRAENLTLPREGVQVLLFLWDTIEAPSADSVAYKASHPQNIYDLDVAPEVRAAANRPRSVGDGRFLRAWDREMAFKLRQREADEALLTQKGGEENGGLKLRAVRPALSLRGGNSFAVTADFENLRAREQALYDGPAGGYGVVLTPVTEGANPGEAAEKGEALILRISARGLIADSGVLAISDITDFASISPQGRFTKELFFDARDFPVLERLKGPYRLKVLFSSAHDGRGLDIGAPVWTGSLLSEELPIIFSGKKP